MNLAKAWDPSQQQQHPRGMPGNAGEFRPKTKAKPVAEATVADPALADWLAEQRRQQEQQTEQTGLLLPGVDTFPQTGQLLPQTGQALPQTGQLLPQAGQALPTAGQALPTAYDLSLPTAEARAEHRRRQLLVVRRIVRINKEPGFPPPPRMNGVYLAADVYNVHAGRHFGEEYFLGEEVDFSHAQQGSSMPLVAYHTQDWDALNSEVMRIKRGITPENQGLAEDMWRTAAPTARAIWQHVLRDPERALRLGDGLTDAELQEIAELAGVTAPGYSPVTPREIRVAIQRDIPNVEHGEGGLAQAFADYATWRHPDWWGEPGANLAAVLEAGRDFQPRIALDLAPVEQVFYFQGARRSDCEGQRVTPFGDYQIVDRDYKSAFASLGPRPPVYRMGLVINYLQPRYAARVNPGDAVQFDAGGPFVGHAHRPPDPARGPRG